MTVHLRLAQDLLYGYLVNELSCNNLRVPHAGPFGSAGLFVIEIDAFLSMDSLAMSRNSNPGRFYRVELNVLH